MSQSAWQVTKEEREYLKNLAAKQAAYAKLPVMAKRKQQWTDLNDFNAIVKPPIVIETWTFDRDFMPGSVFRCTTETGRDIEGQLLKHIRNYELIGDDKVMPDTFDISWFADIDQFGIEIPRETLPDSQGVETGYRWDHPIKDIEKDFGKLKPVTCKVDREKTRAWQAFVQEIVGDSLAVRIRTWPYGATMLTNSVIMLMGMERFFTAMTDNPEAVHRLMAYLRDNCLFSMRWAEKEGLLRANSGNQDSFGSSYNFTRRLPPDTEDVAVKLNQMWGAANSQETVGISPSMFGEFCFPYYEKVCEPLGLLYYGCCEPVHVHWAYISRLPHLTKVSISKWCNQRFVADAVRGKNIVMSRKPDPNLLGVNPKLDEEAWSAHIRETLELTQGVPLEILVRDVYTVHGDLTKPKRAVELARQEIEKHWRP